MTTGFGLIGAGQMAHIHAVAIAEQAPGRARLVVAASGTRAQMRDLVEAIEDGRPPTIGGEDGLAAVAMATGALRSWREDIVVRL